MVKTETTHVPGHGTLVLRGKIWHMKYQFCGDQKMETTGEQGYKKAVEVFRKTIADLHSGQKSPTNILVGELLDDLMINYRKHNPKSVDTFARGIVENHLRPAFGQYLACKITTAMLTKYVDDRLASPAAPATVTNEISLLRRAFNLGRQTTPVKVTVMPSFGGVAPPVDNAREGFFEEPDYEAFKALLPPDEQVPLIIAYNTGARASEVLWLEWSSVDFERQIITYLDTKNHDDRLVPMGGPGSELYDCLEARRAVCATDVPWVCFRTVPAGKRARAGDRIKTLTDSKPWKDAQEKLTSTALMHDCRRTMVRNLRKAGVDEVVGMKISGHKTSSVYKRYNIVDATDMHQAVQAMQRLKTKTKKAGSE